MKRIGHIYEQIYSIENLTAAAKSAARGKKKTSYGVRLFLKDSETKLLELQQQLISGTFRTSEYRTMTIVADRGKVREISKLPFFPDRILHHAIMRVINPILTKSLIYDTYACINSRGVTLAVNRVRNAMKDKKGSAWCLKIDIQKFYPNIDQQVLISHLRRKFKDERFISLISEIICSTEKGLPIGSYTSQLLANFAISGLDHFIKENLGVKYYFRYCDDMVFLGESKERMWEIYEAVNDVVNKQLNLIIKPNYAVFPVGVEIKNETKTRKRSRGGQRAVDRLPGISVLSQKDIAA
jgi:retron-type reverse transcriptase